LKPHFPKTPEKAQIFVLEGEIRVAVADHQPMVEPVENLHPGLYLIVKFPLSVLIPLLIF
jgi:hypothetical protein